MVTLRTTSTRFRVAVACIAVLISAALLWQCLGGSWIVDDWLVKVVPRNLGGTWTVVNQSSDIVMVATPDGVFPVEGVGGCFYGVEFITIRGMGDVRLWDPPAWMKFIGGSISITRNH